MVDQNPQSSDSRPWQALQSNMRELVRAWKAAHKSVLGFHWKKLPPFSMIFPQVDFLRIQRVMETVKEQATQQGAIAKRLQKGAESTPNASSLCAYYQAMASYFQALVPVCTHLQSIARSKHEKLAKGSIPLGEFNATLKAYEASIQALMTLVEPARMAWNNLDPAFRAPQQ